MSENTYNIMMCGPSGVGKTSTLAAMYNQMLKNSSINIKIKNSETQLAIENRLKELYEIKDIKKGDPIEELIHGTAEIRHFDFTMDYLDITFIDYPGGWHNTNMNTLKDMAKESHVLIVAVDSVFLMEEPKLNERYNNPTNIKTIIDTLEEGSKNNGHPRLVIFVLTKSEAYEGNGHFEKLMEAFENGYQACINPIKNSEKIVSVAFPVLTIGCVRFIEFERKRNSLRAVFRKLPNKSYSPKFADQVLMYVIRFVVKQRRGGKWTRLLDWMKGLKISEDLEKLAGECKTNEPVRFYSNKKILEV